MSQSDARISGDVEFAASMVERVIMHLSHTSAARLDAYLCCCCEVEHRNPTCVVGYKSTAFTNTHSFVATFGSITNSRCNGFVQERVVTLPFLEVSLSVVPRASLTLDRSAPLTHSNFVK